MVQQERWSSLPDDIIIKIISHLNFPRFSTVTISATYFDVNIYEPVKGNISEIWNIVNNLFTIFTKPSIDTFSLLLHESLYEEPCVGTILDSRARRLRACNTRHISIQSVGYCSFAHRICPPSLLQIHSLESLSLSVFFNDYDQFVSHPIILPNLNRLTLHSVNYEFLEWLLSCCPSLECLFFSLKLKPKRRNGPVSISSKNLNWLYIILDDSNIDDDIEVIIDAPILKLLDFEAKSSFLSFGMLNSISNLESLELRDGVTTKFFNSPTKTIFPYLTKLTLYVSSSKILEAILKQQMLAHYCPNLEVLVFNFCNLDEFVWDTKVRFVLVEHVKHLELRMGGVRLNRRTLNFVTWLLRSALVLEKLVVIGYAELPSTYSISKALFCTTLFTCAEETSRCQIELLDGYKLD